MGIAKRSFLITGCGSGIGRHLAQVLIRQGAYVLATDINRAAVEDCLSEIDAPADRAVAMEMDVRDPAQWDEAVALVLERWQQLDVLLNVAGVVHGRYVHEATAADVNFHLDINTKGAMYGSIAASRVMVPKRSGHIINVASIAGLIPVPGISFYSASKFAVRGFSHAIADELEAHGVFVTVICPNAVATPMLDAEASQPETMLSFSGSRILSIKDLEDAVVLRALTRRPREIILPSTMSFFARFTTAFPALVSPLLPYFRRRGAEAQARYREMQGK